MPHSIFHTDTTAMMARYHEALELLTRNDIPAIKSISTHMTNNGGKQLRPMLAMLSAAATGLTPPDSPRHPLYRTAAAIQLLHNSTLIHDDVVDNSSMRRGEATVNNIWGNKVAVLSGDYFLSVVLRTINNIFNQELTDAIDNIVADMAQGELLQLQHTGNYMIDEETYISIITLKTASFMSASCLAGAIVADADMQTKQTLKEFGLNLGLAFQIRDDIHDLLPSETTGKPQGIDLCEHKTTLPVILALKKANANNKKDLVALLQKSELNNHDIESIIQLLNNLQAVELATARMRQYLDTAIQTITTLPSNQYTESLVELAEQLKK